MMLFQMSNWRESEGLANIEDNLVNRDLLLTTTTNKQQAKERDAMTAKPETVRRRLSVRSLHRTSSGIVWCVNSPATFNSFDATAVCVCVRRSSHRRQILHRWCPSSEQCSIVLRTLIECQFLTQSFGQWTGIPTTLNEEGGFLRYFCRGFDTVSKNVMLPTKWIFI